MNNTILNYLKTIFKNNDNVDIYTQEFEFSFSSNPSSQTPTFHFSM